MAVCRAQSLENFVTLKSGAPIPADFTTLSTEKYKKDYSENLDKELGKDFFLSSRFYIDELLLSGQVLFNEPVSNFVAQVAKHLLKTEPELYSHLRFYVLKSNVVNAFSTDQGIIIVTTGLIAHLQSEAELAFILAHEISHFTRKHVRESYKEFNKSLNDNAMGGVYTEQARIASLSVYSKLNELEADSVGLSLFLNSKYSPLASIAALEMLRTSDYPFECWNLDTNIFNSGGLIIPAIYFEQVDINHCFLRQFEGVRDVSTHPEIETRIEKIRRNLVVNDSSDIKFKTLFLSEDEFFKVRDLCRFESINIYLYERQYNDALYLVLALKSYFSENRFLDLCLVKSIYGIAKYKNQNTDYPLSSLSSRNEKMDAYFQISGLFSLLDNKQISVVAYRVCFDMCNKYKDDAIFSFYERDMKKELAWKSNLDPRELRDSAYVFPNRTPVVDTTKTDTLSGGSFTLIRNKFNQPQTKDIRDKYKSSQLRIETSYEITRDTSVGEFLQGMSEIEEFDKEQKEGINLARYASFYLHAFCDIDLNNFVRDLQRIELTQDSLKSIPVTQSTKKELRKYERFGRHEGIESMIVVDPYVNILQVDKEINHVKSEKQKVSVQQVFDNDLSRLQLNLILIDSKNLDAENVSEYNNLGVLNQWGYELYSHDKIEMLPSNYDQVLHVTSNCGSKYIMFSFIEIRKDKPEIDILHAVGLVFLPTTLISAADLYMLQNYLGMYNVIINSETSKVEYNYYIDVEVYGKEFMINNYIYDLLYQLGPDPKKDKK